jgi:hypothetical protein
MFFTGTREERETETERGGKTWQVEPFISEAAMFLYENGVCEYQDLGKRVGCWRVMEDQDVGAQSN